MPGFVVHTEETEQHTCTEQSGGWMRVAWGGVGRGVKDLSAANKISEIELQKLTRNGIDFI